jgi:hypothetical protein
MTATQFLDALRAYSSLGMLTSRHDAQTFVAVRGMYNVYETRRLKP